MPNTPTPKRQRPDIVLPAGAWGCLVSSAAEAKEARRLGAAWLVATHAGLLAGDCPASVMGLLPFADANGTVLDLADDVVAAAGPVPVLAGILAIDQFRQGEQLLRAVAAAGFAGIQTYPSVGILDGGFRYLLDRDELGRPLELRMLTRAAAAGLYASGIAFHPGETAEAASNGADMVLVHLPLAREGGQGEWDAEGRSFLRAAAAEAHSRAAVAAFVPAGFGRVEFAPETLRQFESVACAGENV